jgi:hypothetical protein
MIYRSILTVRLKNLKKLFKYRKLLQGCIPEKEEEEEEQEEEGSSGEQQQKKKKKNNNNNNNNKDMM